MATIRFTVPDQLKKDFEAAFPGKNRDTVIARMMIRAVAELKHAGRLKAFRLLTAARSKRPRIATKRLLSTRKSGRP